MVANKVLFTGNQSSKKPKIGGISEKNRGQLQEKRGREGKSRRK